MIKFLRKWMWRGSFSSAVSKSLCHWDEFIELFGGVVVAVALLYELQLGTAAQTKSLDEIQDTQRIQGAMIDQIKPRKFTEEQYKGFVAALSGKLKTVRVFLIPDPEAYSFGLSVMAALTEAHIGEYETDLKTNETGPVGAPNTGVEWYVSPADPNKELIAQTLLSSCWFIPSMQCSVLTPEEPIDGVPSPSLFVLLHPFPLNFTPSWYAPGIPKSPWEGSP